MSSRDAVVALDRVESLILSIRGRRVILDSDLARLYGVTTSRLNEQVKRNPDRFPPDFMFRLSRQEFTALISQNATSKGRGGRRKLPYVFTEHGAIMAANVLNSGRAIEVSVYVVRAFVRLREMMGANKEVAAKLGELERNPAEWGTRPFLVGIGMGDVAKNDKLRPQETLPHGSALATPRCLQPSAPLADERKRRSSGSMSLYRVLREALRGRDLRGPLRQLPPATDREQQTVTRRQRLQRVPLHGARSVRMPRLPVGLLRLPRPLLHPECGRAPRAVLRPVQ
jgi:hypothetical protein